MAKSVISCGSIENTVDFASGDIFQDKHGNLFLLTDESHVVVIYNKTTGEIGTEYDLEDWELTLVPKGLSVTLTQE